MIAGVQLRIVPTGLADPAAQVVGHQQGGNTVKKFEGAHMALQPVPQRLAPGGFGVGVDRRPQHRHKDLGLTHFPGGGTDHRYGDTAVVDKALLTGLVNLAHGAPLSPVLCR